MMAERANPLGDLTDFQPRTPSAPPKADTDKVAAVAEAHNFPSREAPKPAKASTPKTGGPRRFRTGRNQQLNIKASAETIERMTRIADDLKLPFGAVLEKAIDALERAGESTTKR